MLDVGGIKDLKELFDSIINMIINMIYICAGRLFRWETTVRGFACMIYGRRLDHTVF